MGDGTWYVQQRQKLSKRLYGYLAEHERGADRDEPVPVIVVLKEGFPHDDEEIRRRVHAAGGKIYRELPILDGFAALLPGDALAELTANRKVKRIHHDREAHPCLDVGLIVTRTDSVQESGHTGRGVTIAIVDSGTYPHPDLMKPSPRIVAWYDAVNGRPNPYDDHGHGTHVAGIAAGNGYASGGRYRGVAPGANIAAVKVADADGSARMSQVVEGMQWVLNNREKYGIRVVNLSLGSDPSEPYWHDPLCQAAEKLWRSGMVVTAAAGNDGPEPGSIDTPGNDPYIITVGAIADQGTPDGADDAIPEFSSRGPTLDGVRKPDILAPGVAITAPQTGGGYVERTGTSMSTPFVSGAAALLLAKEPNLTPDQVKRRLRASVDRRLLAGGSGPSGCLNVRKLLRLADS